MAGARSDKLIAPLERLDAALVALLGQFPPSARNAIERWRADAAALRFHLRPPGKGAPPVNVVLGGSSPPRTKINP